jgi:hypothetical protein
VAPSLRKRWQSLRRQAAVARSYSSLADSDHGICFYKPVMFRAFLLYHSQCSDRLRDGRSSPEKAKSFLFTTASRPDLGPTQPPLQWVLWAISPGIKRPEPEAPLAPLHLHYYYSVLLTNVKHLSCYLQCFSKPNWERRVLFLRSRKRGSIHQLKHA